MRRGQNVALACGMLNKSIRNVPKVHDSVATMIGLPTSDGDALYGDRYEDFGLMRQQAKISEWSSYAADAERSQEMQTEWKLNEGGTALRDAEYRACEVKP